MPKRLVSGGWIEKPCIFRSPSDATPDCTFCQEPFTFWNGRRHCAFCGYVFHRLECTRKCSVEGEFFRRRICVYCDRYGVYKKKLCTGDEFTCYSVRRGRSDAVIISMSEMTAELVFHWTAHGTHIVSRHQALAPLRSLVDCPCLLETVDLLSVEVQKGFSHAGHMRTADYEPLKSFSLLLKDGDQVKNIDLKATSAWLCQLWVDGINSAKYVYQRMLEQEEAMFLNVSATHNYGEVLPITNDGSSVCTNPSKSGLSQEGERNTTTPRDLYKSFSPSSDEASPSPLPRLLKQEKGVHPICASYPISAPGKQTSSMFVQDYSGRSWQSTPGLPYQQSPLSSICSCHAYQIVPSRSVDLREQNRGQSPVVCNQRCCPSCKLACRIALDLENL